MLRSTFNLSEIFPFKVFFSRKKLKIFHYNSKRGKHFPKKKQVARSVNVVAQRTPCELICKHGSLSDFFKETEE